MLALWRYWAGNPPVHILIANGFGGGVQIKRRPKHPRGGRPGAISLPGGMIPGLAPGIRPAASVPPDVREFFAQSKAPQSARKGA